MKGYFSCGRAQKMHANLGSVLHELQTTTKRQHNANPTGGKHLQCIQIKDDMKHFCWFFSQLSVINTQNMALMCDELKKKTQTALSRIHMDNYKLLTRQKYEKYHF